jgi:hypothetical protein
MWGAQVGLGENEPLQLNEMVIVYDYTADRMSMRFDPLGGLLIGSPIEDCRESDASYDEAQNSYLSGIEVVILEWCRKLSPAMSSVIPLPAE